MKLKEKIVEDLLTAGFPLEVSVSNILNKSNWKVDSSVLYVDPDDQVTRELDVYALKIYGIGAKVKSKEDILIFSHLIIQCKKSSKPWVFFDNAGNDYFWLGFYSLKCGKSDFISKLHNSGRALGFSGHRYKNIKKHKSFHVYDNEKHGNQAIYEALITSCKPLEYYKKMYGESAETAHFFTPIVVLNGTLWSASMSKKSKIILKQVNKLIVRFDYIFGADKKPEKYTYQYIEVITQKEFTKSLKEIEKDNKTLLKSWIKFLNLQKDK